MCRFLLIVVLCDSVFCAGLIKSENSRIVVIGQGPIRGYTIPGKIKVFAFYNVPYATAPLSRHRFQASLPPPVWSNVFEAVDIGIVCPQGHSPDIDLKNKTMQECLIANIFVPDTKEQNLPVLVYVHGGGFQVGYGNQHKWLDFVKAKSVIVVNFNYRLGILGNLCLGTKGSPGNAGLKDQLALLNWVKVNIKHFGGDSEKITIAGCSTGSASVDLLALSKKTEGLFNKMIINSGCSLNVFAVQQDPLEIAKIQARKMNISDSNDINVIEKSYKTAPVELLTTDIFDDMRDLTVVFVPCVERNDSNNSFVVDAPYSIFQNHEFPNMPIMYSFTNMEGLLKISKFDIWTKQMFNNFSDFLPADLQFVNEKEKELLARKIKDFYFKNVKDNGTIDYIQYFTDVMFIYGILKSVQFQIEAKDNKVYLMEYSFTDSNTPVVPNTYVQGADHCSQLLAVVDEEESFLTTEYKAVKKTMRDLWANFIKTGEPTRKGSKQPHWPAFSQKFGYILSVKSKMPVLTSLRDIGLEQRFRFWNDIYEQHIRIPTPPYP